MTAPTNPLAGLTVTQSQEHNVPRPRSGGKPASPKQIALIKKLLAEKDTSGLGIPDPAPEEMFDNLTGGWEGTASQLIDDLFKAPYKGEILDGDDSDLPPAGYFGVDGKRYKIDRPESGKWAGWTFFKTGSDYHDQQRLGTVRPGGTYKGKAEDVFKAIAEDPQAAAEEYARITGRCYNCNRKLEDPESVRLGIGPVCREGGGLF